MPVKPRQAPKRLKKFRPKFGDKLKEIMAEQGLTVRAFAEIVKFDPGYLGGILTARRPPPLPHFPAWADALKLRGDKRQEFIDLGYLTHCPNEVWTMVDALKSEITRLKEQLRQGKP